MQLKRQQRGFTLVEIAVVLVIIGLLLGGVLKGQELISSARVRNLADQQSGIQAAYFGFQDRYRAVPGDMNKDEAASAIGVSDESIYTGADFPGGNANGRLEDPSDTANWDELNAVWAHLSAAGFMKGSYLGSGSAPDAGNTEVSPLNVFSSPVILARHAGYVGASTPRLVLHMGQNIPADIARELDVKVDDGKPETGTLRNAAGSGGSANPYESGVDCRSSGSGGGGTDNSWDVTSNPQNCNPTYLF